MDLTDEQRAKLLAEKERIEAEQARSKKKDRTALMGDIARQYRRSGGFKGDTKVRWTLPSADLQLMRGLVYAIGPDAQWLPEYDGVVDWLADNKGKGLMCIGDCGRGKTVITRDILPVLFKTLIDVRFSDGSVGHPIYNYFLAKELRSRWSEIERCKIVCVDDVGTEPIAKVYGETHNYFAELVDICNDRDKLLICSTNLTQIQLFGGKDDDPESSTYGQILPARYDQRIFSRLVGNTVRVYFEGEDLRMKR